MEEYKKLLDHLHKTCGFDFSPSRFASLKRKINKRFADLGFYQTVQYLDYLKSEPNEWKKLVDLLTVHTSSFFRNALTFEVLAKRTLPQILSSKKKEKKTSLRIWSAGCAGGEEPYSVAILINDLVKKEKLNMDIHIFATDINTTILEKAEQAVYASDQLGNVKLRHLTAYFTRKSDHFLLNSSIKEMVTFSLYDILDAATYVPPESVFGGFDLVLCRNMMIYFSPDRQKKIFDKLYRSIDSNGYLVLGEAESVPARYKDCFSRQDNDCHIYGKKA